jgi:hypothetical protein
MNPNSVYEKLVKVGTDWADKEQAANLLEGTLKVCQSQDCHSAQRLWYECG